MEVKQLIDAFRIADLLARHIRNQLSASKQQELQVWLLESEEHAQLLKRVSDPANLARYREEVAAFDFEAAWAKLEQQINQPSVGGRLRRRWIRWAAYTDPHAQKVADQLQQLNAALAQSASYPPPAPALSSMPSGDLSAAPIDRLEQLMHPLPPGSEADPEMEQLNTLLEKLLDVQNPDRVKERLRQSSEQRKGKVFAVTAGKAPDPISSLEKGNNSVRLEELAQRKEAASNGFYSLDNTGSSDEAPNAIAAVIHETQTLVNGATVKMRLTSEVFINGQLIPAGTWVFGLCALNGERLSIQVASIRYRDNLFPVELSVFDLDGIAGIYIPGAINREIAKESTDRGLQNIGLSTMDPSIGVQAASVGVEAAKSLFSKKVKLIRVTVKAGYQVLLRDDKQKQQD